MKAYAGFFAGLVFIAACDSRPAADKFEFFDAYLNDQFVSTELKQKHPLDLSVEDVNNARAYLYALRFKQTNDYQFYLFSLFVAQAGVLIDPDKYHNEYKDFAAQGRRADELEAIFPSIGKRAKSEAGFFGPGGSSYSLVFTTSDGKYDVRLVIGMLLPDNVDFPDIDIREAAQRISSAYDTYNITSNAP